MKQNLPISIEFIYQIFALIVIVILVHAAYVAVIRPNADAFMEAQAIALASEETPPSGQSLFVMIPEHEHETGFLLMFWALAIMGYKGFTTVRFRGLLTLDLIPLAEGVRILPEDTLAFSRRIEALPPDQRESLLPRTLLAALHRFGSTRNIQDVAHAMRASCEAEGERLDAELAMIRYIAWAIPSVGFIGTVRGIGQALGHAHKAVEGDILEVTSSLGVAFNSTLIALLISIVLMFLLHQLQLLQERYVLDTEAYCEERLTRRLHTRRQESESS